MKPLRIAIVMPVHWSWSMGGAEMQVRELVQRMAFEPNIELHFLARDIDPAFQPVGYQLHRIPAHRSLAGTYPLDVPGTIRLLAEVDPDVVYQRVAGALTGAAAWYARRRQKRMVWHLSSDVDIGNTPWRMSLRSALEQLDRALVNYGARHANTIVAQNREQLARLRLFCGRTDAICIPNFHRPPPAEVPKAITPVTVCWIANIKPLKQPELFLRLAEDFRERSDLRFLMIGARQMEGRSWVDLQARIARLPNLSYKGHLAPELVNAELEKAHLLVNTSLFEGFSNTFIQSWMRGVPVISLRANPDRKLDGENYGICADGSYQKLHAAVDLLARDRLRRETMASASRTGASKDFSIANADRLLSLLCEPQQTRDRCPTQSA